MRVLGSALALFLFMGTIGSKSVQAESALEMSSYCKLVAEAQHTGTQIILMPTTYETGRCWGAFAAIQSSFNIGYEATEPFFEACLPEQSSRQQLVLVFVRYVDENPQSAHEDFFLIAIDAFQDAFPCPE